MILQRTRKAMTLIELIITMSILATIAAIAVISADDLGENSRYDETDRRGKLIQNSLVGYDTPRFIQDMGRPPVLLVDINASGLSDDAVLTRKKLFLAELVDLEADSTLTYDYENAQKLKKQECSIDTDFNIESTANSDFTTTPDEFPSSVSIKAGWAGPYALNGSENMTDNWGKPWDIYHYGDDDNSSSSDDVLKWATKLDIDDNTFYDTNDELEVGTEIYGIRSVYKEDYASDLSYIFPENNMIVDELVIKLVDASGNAISSDTYKGGFRVFLYLPYCEAKTNEDDYDDATEPKVLEFCVYTNGTTKEFRIRLDTDAEVEEGVDTAIRSDSDIESNLMSQFKVRLDDSTSETNIILTNVPVGSRKVWAYAKSSDSDSSTGIYAPLQNIKITATNNTIELLLNQTF